MNASWDPKRRVVRASFRWEGVCASLDRTNRTLCFCRTDTARKIFSWRKTQATLDTEGTWIYILWTPGDNLIYIGQCGAKYGEREPFCRFQEHIRATRDFHLLKRTRRDRVPLYEWIQKHGYGSVHMTLLEKVTAFNADSREIYWMQRFGKGHLLNRQVPDLRQPKWEWLTRVKSFVHTHRKQSRLPERATIEDTVRHFLQTRHSVLKPAEKLQLILDTRRACDSQLASQVYQKAKEQIRRDTGTLIHRSMTVRVPLASVPMKRKITEHIQRVFMSHEKVPELYRQFLASSIPCVRGQVPKFGDFCKTYRPHISTDQLVHDVVTANTEDVCNCQHMHKCFGLPLVNGHVFTRDFSWVNGYDSDPCLSADLFHQNLKNPLLPSWGMVARSTTRELHRTLKTVHGMSTQARLQVIIQVLDMV